MQPECCTVVTVRVPGKVLIMVAAHEQIQNVKKLIQKLTCEQYEFIRLFVYLMRFIMLYLQNMSCYHFVFQLSYMFWMTIFFLHSDAMCTSFLLTFFLVWC